MRIKKSYSCYFKLSVIKETETLRDREVCRKCGLVPRAFKILFPLK